VLKQAFNDIEEALDDISNFRRNALPQMAQSIVEMGEITDNMEDKITQYEKGNQISPEDIFEITDKQEK